MNTEDLLDIVRSGVLAPSADNRSRLRFELRDSSILLWCNQRFEEEREAHQRILGLIGFGATVENMLLRANELGFAAELVWFPSNDTRLIARIALTRDESIQTDSLVNAIEMRHTNRRLYVGPALSSAEKISLENDLAQIHGVNLLWLEGSRRRQALRLIWLAESERFRRERLHHELFAAIRFDTSWTQSAACGLPPGALQVEPILRSLFKSLRYWPLMRALNRIGLYRFLGLRAGFLPCWQAPALGVIASTLPLEEGALAVGRAFERLWLRSTLLGLALQPLAASVVLQFGDLSQEDGISSKVGLGTKLLSGWGELIDGATPLMVFRVGRAPPVSVRAGRLPVERYMVPKEVFSGPAP